MIFSRNIPSLLFLLSIFEESSQLRVESSQAIHLKVLYGRAVSLTRHPRVLTRTILHFPLNLRRFLISNEQPGPFSTHAALHPLPLTSSDNCAIEIELNLFNSRLAFHRLIRPTKTQRSSFEGRSLSSSLLTILRFEPQVPPVFNSDDERYQE